MNCKDLEVLLSAYADGELTGVQRDFIEEHLAGCAECRARLADYRKTSQQLLSLRKTPEILDISKATMSRIKLLETPVKLRRWLRPALIAAPIIIILAIVLPLQLSDSSLGPSGIIAKAYAAGSGLESYRYMKDDYRQDSPSEETVHTYHAEIKYTTPDRYHMISETLQRDSAPLPNHIETIRIGDQAYTNIPNVIYEYEEEWFEQMTPTEDKTLDFLNLLAEIETLEDESIDGADCYHYIGEVDIDKFLEWSRPGFERMYDRMDKYLPWGMTTDLEDWIEQCNSSYLTQDMTFEFWIGKDDYLLRQAKLVYQTREGEHSTWNKYKATGIMHYYDFNEVITIEPPLDESGELLEGWSSYTIEPLEIPEEPASITTSIAPRKPSGPQNIPDVFIKALAVTEKLESYSITSKTCEHFNNGWNQSSISIYERGGDYLYHALVEPNDEYEKAYPPTGTMELFIIDDRVYTRNFVTPLWSTDDFDEIAPTSEKNLIVLEMLFDIERLPDEEINGTDCYHYRGILDAEEYLEWVYPVWEEHFTKANEMQKETSGVDLDFELGWKTVESIYRTKEMIYEYWIGKEDYLIRKRVLTQRDWLENPLPLDDLSHISTRQFIAEYYDFNEPVEIEAPLDESGELLEGWVQTTLEE
jgi:hypothetical protein